MIRAIIFDLGGVLIDFPTPSMLEFCADRLGVTVRDMVKVIRPLRKDFQEGAISEGELWDRVCGILGVEIPRVDSLWKEAFVASYREKEAVFEIVAKLRRQKYLLGLLSNTEVPSISVLGGGKYDFDAVVYSCVERLSKPGSEIYKLALSRLNVFAREAVFVDDQDENIKGAEAVGIRTILFRDADQLKISLEDLGIRMDI